MGGIRSLWVLAATISETVSLAVANDAFTIVDAINQAVATHPEVGEAAANPPRPKPKCDNPRVRCFRRSAWRVGSVASV